VSLDGEVISSASEFFQLNHFRFFPEGAALSIKNVDLKAGYLLWLPRTI